MVQAAVAADPRFIVDDPRFSTEPDYGDTFEKLFYQIPRQEFSKRAFLNALCITGYPMKACQAAKVPKSTYKYWLANDPLFVEAKAIAEEIAASYLLEAARERAVNGVQRVRPIFHEGVKVGEETWFEFDGKLLRYLMEAEAGFGLPERFKPSKKIEHTGQITHLMQLAEGAEQDQARFDKALESGAEEEIIDGTVLSVQQE